MKNIDIASILKPDAPKIFLKKGRILIAEPLTSGLYFSRAVILITAHDVEETIGLVLNKTSEINPKELVDEIENFNGILYIGGPCEPNSLHFLHTIGAKIPGAEQITDTVYYGGDFEVLLNMIQNGKANSNNVKFFAGYTGWAANQINSELEQCSWVVSTLNDEKIMQKDINNSWHETVAELGVLYKTWTNIPLHPLFN